MKRLLILLLILPFIAVSGSAQLLYKISGNGLERPSYLFGTCHLASKDFVDDVPGLSTALLYVDQVCGEVESYNDSADEYTSRMLMPEGFSYDQVLDDEHYAQLNLIFIRSTGYSLRSSMLADGAGRMKPLILSEILLPMMQPVDLSGLDIDLQNPLDPYFQVYARRNGLSIAWLEETDVQMELLFERPFEEQLQGLIWWLDNRELSNDLGVRLVKAYFAQDIALINEVVGESIVRYSDEFVRLMFDARNLAWAAKMPSIMEDKPTLFFVGVGHLAYGDNGILKLLSDAGYTVTPVGVSEGPGVPATFKGGDISVFRRWVMDNMKYPKAAAKKNIQGDVVVEFVIDENGELGSINVLKTPDPLLSDAVVAVLKKSPKWKPAEQRGKRVKMKFVFPVTFKVQN
jgi:TonB family protein